MIAFLSLLVGFVLGLPVGASILRDMLDGLWTWPRKREPKSEPKLPPMWVEHLGHLNTPAVWRKSKVIDV